MSEGLMLWLMLLGAHWVADYPLQGDFLAKAKGDNLMFGETMRQYHLIAHAGIHGAAVALVTGSVVFGFVEWGLHALIDELKVRRVTSFKVDQALHIACKFTYLIIIIGSTSS